MIIRNHASEAEYLERIGAGYARVFGRRLLATRGPGQPEPAFEFRLTLESDGALMGWHFGESPDGRIYRMTNSAILPEFRRRGVYGRLSDELMRILGHHGIRSVLSRHRPENEAILAAKRKQGFLVTGEVDDPRYGRLIETSRELD
jgi:ribosomal protein S18 acetylase RimI-like enzyme